MSARLGHNVAYANLARCYEKGIGVNRDMKMTISLYERASKMIIGKATNNLAICYENGYWVDRDVGIAFKLCLTAFTEESDYKDKQFIMKNVIRILRNNPYIIYCNIHLI